jgi:hypothetical protein
MSNITDNTPSQNFTDPSIYIQKLQTIKQQLAPILDDYKQAYINYNMDPGNLEYQQVYYNLQANLTTISSGLDSLETEVQNSTDELNDSLAGINEEIIAEKETNAELKLQLGMVENTNNASSEMISNYKQMYEYGYLKNWGLALSILGVLIAISRVFPGRPNIPMK